MRKKTISKLFDDFMWYLIYLLPIFVMLIFTFKTGQISLSQSLVNCGLGVLTDNPILSNLSQIFGVGGVLPFFESSDILIYLSYFISVFVVHLAVDFVLFIPRLCHKWLESLYNGGCAND